MSKIEVNQISSQCGSTLTVGQSGDTVTLAAGATQTGFGRTGTVDWQTGSIKTGTFVPVNGEGYFVDTSGGVSTANLPAGSAGAIVSFADYTRTFQTNNLIITPNGSEKIGGVAASFYAQTEGQSITLVYIDATEGWINTMDSTGQAGLNPTFITATGGTITTVCTDYKVHTFTGPGTFTVCSVGNALGSNSVDYIIVAGGGGGAGGTDRGAGAGGGGFRGSNGTASGSYSAGCAPLVGPVSAFPVAATGYPIVIGGGGAGACTSPGVRPGTAGVASSAFSLTSAGGGYGGGQAVGGDGGSGGGGGDNSSSAGGAGNTPPVSPPQGTNGGAGSAGNGSGGGGGISGVGTTGTPTQGGPGGQDINNSITGSPVYYSGGAGGGGHNPGTALGAGSPGGSGGAGGAIGGAPPHDGVAGATNTGGGGGGGSNRNGGFAAAGGTGGSGIVIIRYKFQ